jgi:hypothetical protein
MGFLGRVVTRIINEVKGINWVVYDVTRSRRRRSSGSERALGQTCVGVNRLFVHDGIHDDVAAADKRLAGLSPICLDTKWALRKNQGCGPNRARRNATI